jgi:hypothetical protein
LDDGIEQLNYLEGSLVCVAQANGRTVARSTSAPPAAVLGVRIVSSDGGNKVHAPLTALGGAISRSATSSPGRSYSVSGP